MRLPHGIWAKKLKKKKNRELVGAGGKVTTNVSLDGSTKYDELG